MGEEFETAIKKKILTREKNGATDSKTSSAKTLMDSDRHQGKNDNVKPDGEYQHTSKFMATGDQAKRKQVIK